MARIASHIDGMVRMLPRFFDNRGRTGFDRPSMACRRASWSIQATKKGCTNTSANTQYALAA